MNMVMIRLSAVVCCSILFVGSVQATTWNIDVASGTTSETGTIPSGTDAISKTGSGTYDLKNSGTSAFHGEATVVGSLRFTGGSLDMGGETITKKGSGWFQLMGLSVLNPGDFICQQGTISLITTCNLGAPGTHKLSLQGGALQLNSLANAVAWPIECTAAATFDDAGGGSSSANNNKITGSITASDNMTISTKSRLTFANDFSMVSGKVFRKDGDGVLRLCGKTTMDGVTTWLQKGLLLYGNGADATGCLPSSEYTTEVRRPAIKVETGAKVSYNGTGSGYGTLGYQNYAAFWMTGGQVDVTLDWGWRIGQSGGADMLVSGGALTLASGQMILGNDADNGTKKNPYTVSVSGQTSTLTVKSTINSGASEAVLNVSGGAVLSSKMISQSAARPGFTVNFDNAVFKPRFYASAFGKPNDSASPKLLIQDGGLVYDTTDVVNDKGAAGYSELYSSLEKPTGKVVSAIGLPTAESDPANYDAFAAAYYPIPVSVRISGSGTGASAFLEIDELTRKPVRIVVTGAGTGYDDNTTVTLDSPDGKSRYTCPVTLKTPAGTGSFVKRGSNSLVLYGTNTYGGATILEAGYTKFVGDKAYPQGSPLTVKAGANLQSQDRTVSYQVRSLSGTGTITTFDGGVEVSEKLIVDLADLRAGRYMNCKAPLTIGKDVVVEVVDSDNLWTPVTADFIKVDQSYAITCSSSLATEAAQGNWVAFVKDNCLHLTKPGLVLIFF